MSKNKLDEIHMSLVNGQLTQAADQIEEYGVYDFFLWFERYLEDTYTSVEKRLEYFSKATRCFIRKQYR